MKYHLKKMTKWVAVSMVALVSVTILGSSSALAASYSLTMAPMSQSIVVNPDESYKTSFTISNSSGSTQDTYYKIESAPFYMSNDNKVEYEAVGDSGKIVDWITFNVPTEGKLAPNETEEVVFTIDVPKSAPAGGQYLSVQITASAKPFDDSQSDNAEEDGATIKEVKKMVHLVYAEVTGDTKRTGEIKDAALPSFLLSGKITGSAVVKNTGNVHGDAKYILKVYPLFSGEEIYTNEEKPTKFTVLPDRELYSEIAWDQTPPIGMFNADFIVEFEGEKVEISKLIIICPVWLLFIIFFVIAAIIIWIVMRVRARNQKRAEN